MSSFLLLDHNDFLLASHSTFIPIYHHFRHIARHWTKCANFSYPIRHLAPLN